MKPETKDSIISDTVDEILEGIDIGMADESNLEICLRYMASRLESIHNDAALLRLDRILKPVDEEACHESL